MPYPATIKSSTNTAPIIKAGHTASDRHGTDPDKKGIVPAVRELNLTTSKQ